MGAPHRFRSDHRKVTGARTIWLTLPALGALALAQDPVQISPDHFKVEVDNQWVRALRVKLGPHQSVSPFQQSPSVIVYLTGAQLKLNQPVTHRAGDIAYFNAAKHPLENLSDQPFEAIMVELKPGAPKSPPVVLDPVKLDPEHHLVPLENARVRVLRTILEPHLKSPEHEHPHYVVVYLTELHTTMTFPDGHTADNPRSPGDVAWRDALKHVTENIADKTAMEIQVEIK